MKQHLDAMGAIGIVEDQMSNDIPANSWSLARNVRMRDGYAGKIAGQAAIYDPPSVIPYFLMPLVHGSTRYLIYAGAAKIYCVTGSTHTDITRASGGDYTGGLNTWNGGVFTGLAILNNGVDAPQFWAGVPATPAADMTNWPSGWKCKSIKPFRNFLIAMNMTKSSTNYPSLINWSTEADPGSLPATWDVTDATHEAGQVDLADSQGAIIDGLQLGEQFVIYKEDAIYTLQYIGGQSIFQLHKAIQGVGLLTPNALCAFPGGHVFISQGDVMTFDGISAPQSILKGRLKRYFVHNFDSANYSQAFCVCNLTLDEVWICYPTPGSTYCDEAIIWNYVENTLTLRDLPNAIGGCAGLVDNTVAESWDSDSDAWDSDVDAWNAILYTPSAQRVVLASADTKIYLTDATTLFNGSAFTAYLRKEGMDLGDASTVKTITSIRPRFDAADGLQITARMGGAMLPDGSITWSSPLTFTVGTDDRIYSFATGRYLAIHFESTSSGDWRLKSLEFEFTPVSQF